MTWITTMAAVLCLAVTDRSEPTGAAVPSQASVAQLMSEATNEQAAAIRAAFIGFEAKWNEASVGWADASPALVLDSRKTQRRLSADFEERLAGILKPDDAIRAAWNRDWRRERCLMELAAIMRQPLQDVVGLLRQLDAASQAACEHLAVQYAQAIDVVLAEWDSASDPILERAYGGGPEESRRNARQEIARFATRVMDIHADHVARITHALSGADRDRFVRSAASHPCSHLFQPQPMDVIMDSIAASQSLPPERVAAAQSIHSEYSLKRDVARAAIMKAHERWMQPQWTQARIRQREAELAAGRSTGEWMLGHPGLSDLRRLETLESRAIAQLRSTLGDDVVATLPATARLLIQAWALQSKR